MHPEPTYAKMDSRDHGPAAGQAFSAMSPMSAAAASDMACWTVGSAIKSAAMTNASDHQSFEARLDSHRKPPPTGEAQRRPTM